MKINFSAYKARGHPYALPPKTKSLQEATQSKSKILKTGVLHNEK